MNAAPLQVIAFNLYYEMHTVGYNLHCGIDPIPYVTVFEWSNTLKKEKYGDLILIYLPVTHHRIFASQEIRPKRVATVTSDTFRV